MVKLSGILEYSMGGFLCLRGFANFKELSRISKENPDVQRKLIEDHKGEMADFLNRGDYRFFPEVVLSVALESQGNHDEVNGFYESIRKNEKWGTSKLGDYTISVFYHESGDKNKIAHITFDESVVKLNRVDGNHRLSAADSVTSDFKIPFCLVLCRTKEEESQYSTAIFHNINAKQIPLKLEENLSVILSHPEVFSDDKLKTDPSFGWKYYLARKANQVIKFEDYPFISLLLRNSKYSYLTEEFKLLLDNGTLSETDESVNIFSEQLPKIEVALQEAKLKSIPENLAVIGALSYYKLTDESKYQQFILWIKKNGIAEALDIHMNDLISIFDKVYENIPKAVFVSMQFSRETEDTYQTLKDVQYILKCENGIDFRIIKVDEHKDGYSDEIYHRIVDGIKSSALVIADLSYGNRNVHHEIGYAQGLGKKVLLLYKTRDDVDAKSEIGSNISMHDQVRFKNQTELRPALLRKIRHFFGIETE